MQSFDICDRAHCDEERGEKSEDAGTLKPPETPAERFAASVSETKPEKKNILVPACVCVCVTVSELLRVNYI